MLTITPFYAGLIALLFLWLTARVIQNRMHKKILIDDGGDADTLLRIRVHANCAEFAPLGLLLLGMAEIQGMPALLVHVFGLMLLAGRVLHAVGMSAGNRILWARQWGMILTLLMLLVTALANIGHAIF